MAKRGPGRAQGSPTGVLPAALALLLAPVAFRAALLWDSPAAELAASDLRGFLSDTGAALLAFSALALVGRLSRLAAVALALVWVLIQDANYEYVRALGSLANVLDAEYLANRTFLLGSASAVSRPLLLAALLLASAVLVWRGLARVPLAAAAGAAVAGAGLLAAHGAWGWNDDVAIWRQTNAVPHNLAFLLRHAGPEPGAPAAGGPGGFPDAASAMLDRVPGLRADLSGEPIAPLGPHGGRGGMNVLLVLLESVSGVRLESVARANGVSSDFVMPELDAIARRGLGYTAFVDHQRKTARGLYAILCGELPNLLRGSTKMADYAAGDRTCLPALLRAAGYRTVYLQGAPLAFHLKDQFMPRAGFERVHGHDYFEREYLRSFWGVDDRTLLEHALELMDELEGEGTPWFLTLLTVGTHHPYTVPDDFESATPDEYHRALAYLDQAVGRFQRGLEERGVLERTLVLYASDEARGYDGGGDWWSARISQNWGFLSVQLPERRRAEIAEPFAQIDLPLSILDFLGLGESGPHLFGRSVFRRYDSGRFVFFGNTNQHTVGAFDPLGALLFCVDDFRKCRRFETPPGRPFSNDRVERPWRPEDDVVGELARRSQQVPAVQLTRRDFELRQDPRVVVDKTRTQIVWGGQHLHLRPSEWLEVEMEIDVGGGPGQMHFKQILRSGGGKQQVHGSEALLNAGDRLFVHYAYAPGRDAYTVQARGYVRLVEGEPFELQLRRGRLTIHSREQPPGPGVTVLREEVVHGPAGAAGARG